MTKFEVGDLVKFKNGRGGTFRLEEFEYEYDPKEEIFGYGSDDYGYCNIQIDSPDDIKMVMPAAEASARKPPSADEIARGLNLLSGWGHSAVDVDETEEDGPGEILCYGTAQNGLRVAFKVTVSEVYEIRGF